MRVKYIESLPDTPRSTFVRLYVLLSILLIVDLALSKYYLTYFFENGPTVKVLFLTEYSIMAVISITSWVRLTMHAVNIYMQNAQLAGNQRGDDGPEPIGWEGHERAIFYLDIASDLLQSAIYILFFGVIMSKYGLPIHLLRDIYVAVHSMFKRVNDLVHYRRLTTNLDQRFPEATANDLEDQQICVVCRNEMVFGQLSVKKLPCGHMFHANCLRGWLERGHNCPTCIAPVDRDDYEKYLRDRGEIRQQPQQAQPEVNQQQQQQPVDNQQAELNQQALIDQLQQQQDELLRSLSEQLEQQQQVDQPEQFNNRVNVQQQTLMNQADQMVLNNIMNSVTLPQAAAFQGGDASSIVMRDMYIKYLENTRILIDETLEQLKK
ncbi:HRD1 [Acrasis kona]|uniref:RING-type E3 ubiquitin transferase n=1 Tax=Acrasis kona TaxID=1008807 RepID=A0AAW2YT04_9EUKA